VGSEMCIRDRTVFSPNGLIGNQTQDG